MVQGINNLIKQQLPFLFGIVGSPVEDSNAATTDKATSGTKDAFSAKPTSNTTQTDNSNKLNEEIDRINKEENTHVIFEWITEGKDKDAEEELAGKLRNLIEKRAYYNLTKDPKVFSNFLPYLKSIQNDPNKLKEYIDLVNKIMEKIDIYGGVTSLKNLNEHGEAGNKDTVIKFGKKIEVDPSLKFLIAASIVDAFHSRPDLIERALNKEKRLTINLYQAAHNVDNPFFTTHAGEYFPEKNAMNLDWFHLLLGTANDKDEDLNSVVHEFVHDIDAEKDDNNSSDGIIPEMTKEQRHELISIYNDLFYRAKEYKDKVIAEKVKKAREENPNMSEQEIEEIKHEALQEIIFKTNPPTNLPGMFTSSPQEFLARSISMFHSDPTRLKKALPKLYDLYVRFFNFDPITMSAPKSSSVASGGNKAAPPEVKGKPANIAKEPSTPGSVATKPSDVKKSEKPQEAPKVEQSNQSGISKEEKEITDFLDRLKLYAEKMKKLQEKFSKLKLSNKEKEKLVEDLGLDKEKAYLKSKREELQKNNRFASAYKRLFGGRGSIDHGLYFNEPKELLDSINSALGILRSGKDFNAVVEEKETSNFIKDLGSYAVRLKLSQEMPYLYRNAAWSSEKRDLDKMKIDLQKNLEELIKSDKVKSNPSLKEELQRISSALSSDKPEDLLGLAERLPEKIK